MSITRDNGEVVFNCDKCPEIVETGEEDFQEAFAGAKSEGWRAVKIGNEWEHRCPTCVEDERAKK